MHSFPLDEVENTAGGNDDANDDRNNTVRLILDGGARGPRVARRHRLDLSFCPAVDLPTGDPARPRPPIVRAAPVEVRFCDCRTEEYLDEGLMGGSAEADRAQVTAFFLRFLAAVGGEAGGGWRA